MHSNHFSGLSLTWSMMIVIAILILFNGCIVRGLTMDQSQQILNNAIRSAITELSLMTPYGFNFTLDDSIAGARETPRLSLPHACPGNMIQRVACCQPLDVRYLYNVRVRSGGFEVERANNRRRLVSSSPASNLSLPSRQLRQHAVIEQLPDIVSTVMREKHFFKVPLAEVSGSINPSTCRSYFNGTLHVNGRTTAHNVYHAVGDNLMPLVHQILADYVLHPDMVFLPRMGLFGFTGHSSKEQDVPHLRLVNDLMTAGMKTLDKLEGMCFRRVVWGHGAHLFYFDSLVAMRRLAAAFTREFALNYYHIPLPKEYDVTAIPTASPTPQVANQTTQVTPASSPSLAGLRIVLYTRGNSGRGRTMQGEDKLLRALSSVGATTVLCCDFAHSSMEDQIAYAAHADVIIGVHGAALVHGLFMKKQGIIVELKTLYGFTSGLFQIVADSRMGYLAQVDVREYWVPGGHKPIDNNLIARTTNILLDALTYRNSNTVGKYNCFDIPPKHDKVDCVVSPIDVNATTIPNSLQHILGPLVPDLTEACTHTVLHDFRKDKLQREDNELHCGPCRKFTDRRLFDGEFDFIATSFSQSF